MAEPITNPNPQPTETTMPPPAAPQGTNADTFAQALMAAIEKRTSRAENSVAASFAEQYGMKEDEVREILAAEKSKRAKQLPPEVQAQIDAANKLVVCAEVKSLGAAMGLVDADAAMQLMDLSGVKQEGGKVEGVQEALDALKTAKPYLFGATQPQKNWGQPHGEPAPREDGVAAAFRKLNPNLKLD